MDTLRRFYREIWTVDFEFYAPPGERPTPLCLAAHAMSCSPDASILSGSGGQRLRHCHGLQSRTR